MITAYAMLRLLALGRRIARSLESIAESQATLARAAASTALPRPAPRPTVLSRMDPRAVEERERRRRVESGEAVFTDEYREEAQ